jgi:NAD(P)-dependent dehydrogenase (short-subunit alcohol dehydrogenase family)
LCTPEDIASTIRWLVSDASAVTGQLVTVDAGAMIGRPPQVMPR